MKKNVWDLPNREKEIVRKMLVDLGYGADMPLKNALDVAVNFNKKESWK